MSVTCPYCDRAAVLVTGNVIYLRRPDLFPKKFWNCEPCGAYVGCHPKADAHGRGGCGDGTVPLGRLANAALRRAKQQAHAAFDPIWMSGRLNRRAAYAWLASLMGISKRNCHIGMFDVDACRAVVALVRERGHEAATFDPATNRSTNVSSRQTYAGPSFTPAIDCTKDQRPQIALQPVDSRKLHAVGYCPERQILAAQFAVGGAIYHYEGFTPEQHAAYEAAESKGSHFGKHIQVLPSKKYAPDPVAKATDTAQAAA